MKHEEICISESGFDFLEYNCETEPGRAEKILPTCLGCTGLARADLNTPGINIK